MRYFYQKHATLEPFHHAVHRTGIVGVGNPTSIHLQRDFLSFVTEFISSFKKSKITIKSLILKIIKYSGSMLK